MVSVFSRSSAGITSQIGGEVTQLRSVWGVGSGEAQHPHMLNLHQDTFPPHDGGGTSVECVRHREGIL